VPYPPLEGKGSPPFACEASEGITPTRPAFGRSTSPLQSEDNALRPITFHFVTAGCPAGSCFIHQPPATSSHPSGSSICPSSPSEPPWTTAQYDLPTAPDLNNLPSCARALRWAAGCVAVEPMRQRRRARQPEAQRAKVIFQAFAALGTAMHGDARRLIDDQDQAVAIEEPRHHLFCGDVFRGHGGTAITDRPDKRQCKGERHQRQR